MKTPIETALILLIFFSYAEFSPGQIPAYVLSAANFHPNGDYYTANEFTFDIIIRHTDNTEFKYAGGQYSIKFNTLVANGGTLSFTFTSDSSELPENLRPRNPHIVHGSNISQMVLDISNIQDPGDGFLIPPDSEVVIAKLKFKTTAVTFQMQPGPLGGWYLIDLTPEWNNSMTKIYALLGVIPVAIAPFYSWIDDNGLNVNPAELSGFTSYVNENKVILKWMTLNEINNSGFYIERKIINGQWINAGFVNGGGTTNDMKYYTFTERVSTGNYNYRLKQVDYNGNYEYFYLADEVQVGAPYRFELSQNFPNPFNPSTKINYSMPDAGRIKLKVFDISGKEVSALINGIQSAGFYEISFDASDLPGGVYFYSMSSAGFTDTKRMVLIK